jgi:anthranilate synthase component 2
MEKMAKLHKKVYLVDAFDSFVYILYQYFSEFADEVKVVRINESPLAELKRFNPDYLVLSPGPGHPKDMGFLPIIDAAVGMKLPTLGACLGHQSIGMYFGSNVVQAKHIMHGKQSLIEHDGKTIFTGMPNPFRGTRYHSLLVDRVPDGMELSAKSKDDGYIMGLRHKKHPIEGIQFHAESITTERGKDIIKNFLHHYK